MPKIEPNSVDWSNGKKLKIESMEHYNKIIQDGFEITAIQYSFSFESDKSNVRLLLTKQDEKIIADANSIDDYVIHLVELYDFEKKKRMFVYVPDTSIYWEFEEGLLMLPPSHDYVQPPLTTRQLNTATSMKMYNSLLNWMHGEKHNKLGPTKLSEIFSLVCIIEEKNKSITRTILDKNGVTLKKIDQLKSDAKNLDNSIVLSFFLLSRKLGTQFGDALIGIILYDLKKDEALVFNIQSLTSFIQLHEVDSDEGLYDIALYLFKKLINKDLLCTSFIPLPLDSPWYTALPWLSYSALLPVKLDKIGKSKDISNHISIPQFFTFGYSTNAKYGNSFDFSYFASDHDGRAVCILNFSDENKTLKYILRFDQSQGEHLVHMDFSYHDIHEFKLISHRPLDFEAVCKFNIKLFIAMMFAGIFDSYFNTLIKGGLKGIQELAKQNPAFLYTIKWLQTIEAAISCVNENNKNNQAYKVLEKLYWSQQLNEQEKELAKKMHIDSFTLVDEDESCNINGLTYLGYIVLQRYKRGQSHIKIT
jgi:hypothetical protein